MRDLGPEIAALADPVERVGTGRPTADERAALVDRYGRLGGLASWWAAVSPSGGPPARPVAAWPGDDRVEVDPAVAAVAGPLPPRFAAGPPVVPDDPAATFLAAVEAADALVDDGADVVLVHLDAPHAARLLVTAMLGLDAAEALGYPRAEGDQVTPPDDAWIAAVAELRDGLRPLRPFAGSPGVLLAELGDPLLIGGTALILQLAARRTPMLLAGLAATACAAVARRAAPAALGWWQLTDTVSDPLHARLLRTAQLTPVLAHGTGDDALVSGLVALQVLRAAAALGTTGTTGASGDAPGAES